MLNTILLIDDSDVDLLFNSVIIDRAGIAARGVQFNCAASALNHLASAEAKEVDMILLDINMPGMNGFGFLAAYEPLLEAGQAHAPVVMLSSSWEAADKARANRYPCVLGQWSKPLSIKAALTLAAHMLDRVDECTNTRHQGRPLPGATLGSADGATAQAPYRSIA